VGCNRKSRHEKNADHDIADRDKERPSFQYSWLNCGSYGGS
jgi:hypothetical protein